MFKCAPLFSKYKFNMCLKFHRTLNISGVIAWQFFYSIRHVSWLVLSVQHFSHISINNQKDWDPVSSQNWSSPSYPMIWNAHLKKFKHFKSNVLKHHPIKTKASSEHPVECSQNVLANNFGRSLSKLDYWLWGRDEDKLLHGWLLKSL